MRTNLTGFALTVGMGLIVVLLGFGILSMAGLVGFSASEALAGQAAPATESGSPGAGKGDKAVLASAVTKPASPAEAQAIAAGDALFKANCTQCHAVNEKVVGPALAGITKRRPAAWVVSWVHNPAKVIASGDDYAVKLFEENGKQQMPSFAQLSEKDVKSILAWIEAQEGRAAYAPGNTVAVN